MSSVFPLAQSDSKNADIPVCRPALAAHWWQATGSADACAGECIVRNAPRAISEPDIHLNMSRFSLAA
jgi:uncharacterized protein YcgI (DUF1989 family)